MSTPALVAVLLAVVGMTGAYGFVVDGRPSDDQHLEAAGRSAQDIDGDDRDRELGSEIMNPPIVANLVDDGTGGDRGDSADEAPDRFLEQAAQAFSRCMRARGIDFPDLRVGSEGRLIRPDDGVDATDRALRRAAIACRNEVGVGDPATEGDGSG